MSAPKDAAIGGGCGGVDVPLLAPVLPDAPPAYNEDGPQRHVGYPSAEIGPRSAAAGWPSSSGQAQPLPFKGHLPVDPQPTGGAIATHAFVIQTLDGQRIVNLPLSPQQLYDLQQGAGPQPPPQPSFTLTFRWHIALACCVTWCLCLPLGLIAFILAMCAASASKNGKAPKARRLGIASMVLSLIGVTIGVILITVKLVEMSKAGGDDYGSVGDDHGSGGDYGSVDTGN